MTSLQTYSLYVCIGDITTRLIPFGEMAAAACANLLKLEVVWLERLVTFGKTQLKEAYFRHHKENFKVGFWKKDPLIY